MKIDVLPCAASYTNVAVPDISRGRSGKRERGKNKGSKRNERRKERGVFFSVALLHPFLARSYVLKAAAAAAAT